VIVRPERLEDRDVSIAVERAAFGSDLEPGIVVAVRDEPGSFAVVAEDGGEIVGHAQLARAYVGTDEVLSLGPIGVLPDRQGVGIGRALIEAALAEARARGERAVILLGDPAFYPRFGFLPSSIFGLRNPFTGTTQDGFEIAEEDFMLIPLDDSAQTLAGDVRWHLAFGSPVDGPAGPA
jgi:predicted N-acetyltransferase YhbS